MAYGLHWENPALCYWEHTITVFVLFTSSIRASTVKTYCWGISCLLGQTWGHGNCCLCVSWLFDLEASALLSFCFLNLFFFLLLSLQFLSNAMAWLYHCSIELGYYLASISLHHIVVLISLLNSSTNGLFSYSLPLAVLLNSYTNSSIILPSCSSLFNSATFTDSLFPPLNFFPSSVKNSPTISYSSNLPSKSSNVFSFYTSTNPPCIYNSIHWICSSTATPFIFILMYNLHTITKPETFDRAPSNTCGLATSVLVTTSSPAPAPPIYAINAIICS